MPIFLVIEDVGWWQGADGSADKQPFRTGFTRRHCLDDHRALDRLGKKLHMRVVLGMVLGEWGRTNLLQDIAGATWLGSGWDNHINQGKWLDETARSLCDHQDTLEIAMHGLCDEFWQDGLVERSEFHDSNGAMRSEQILRSHLEAFGTLLATTTCRLGRDCSSPRLCTTVSATVKNQCRPSCMGMALTMWSLIFRGPGNMPHPCMKKLPGECGVGLLERGTSPVAWNQPETMES
jgi:hypothetical protein